MWKGMSAGLIFFKAFDVMKEELEIARLRNIHKIKHSNDNIIAVKRETKKKTRKPGE